ncbi:MAG: hypothetical protein KGO94_06045 [Alphaproteobacteria bacterium]|nr:hypothetical protein [Alphaproteobacteria bacterium]
MPAKADAAGYSGTPLWKKLGWKTGMSLCVMDAPAHYASLMDGPNDWVMVKKPEGADALHLFITENKDLPKITALAKHFPPAQMLWVSWPKLSSPLSKGLKEDHIRETAIACGLVDVKVCAVDADWSGLKLMLRKGSERREAHAMRFAVSKKGQNRLA